MMLRLVSAKSLRTIECTDVSQVVVMDDHGTPLIVAHETADGAILVEKADDGPNFDKFCQAIGLKPPKVRVVPLETHA